MKLIAGLGNPGDEYINSRHNAGFYAIDRILEKLGSSSKSTIAGSPVFHFSVEGKDISIIAPMKYMNRSGGVILKAMTKLGIVPDQLLVIHDDIDIPAGECRYKKGGGSGGHNGLKSITEAIGASDYCRIRIGVGRPPEGVDVTDYVLGAFSSEEDKPLDSALDEAARLVIERFL